MRYWLLLLFLALAWPGRAQDNLTGRKQLAVDLILHARYEDALTMLRNSRELRYQDREGRFLMALCHYQLNQLNEAEALLTELTSQERSVFPECWLYLGRIYHARHQFAEAARHYKTYLRNSDEQTAGRAMVIDDLRRCAFGLQLQYRPAEAFVENLGPGLNTAADEFGAVPSLNYDTRLYFTSRRPGNIGGMRDDYGRSDERFGQYYSDIFSARNEGGQWGEVQPLHYLLNSPRHEVLFDFNDDGSVMYYYQGNRWSDGALLVDTFPQGGQRSLSSDPFLGPVDPLADQAAPHFVNATTVIFPSRRPGGYGGLDLYMTTFEDGRWTEPRNLGPTINSAYDETTPFLARDGRTLYFSSNHSERSLGGYDIFRSVYLADLQRWLPPENLGLPVNSAGDDTHLRLARDGFSAFFTSDRKDGFGQRDLYIAYFEQYREEQEPPENPALTYYARQEAVPAGLPSPAPPSPRQEAPRQVGLVLEATPLTGGRQGLLPAHRQMLDGMADLLRRGDASGLLITAVAAPRGSVSETLYHAVDQAAFLLDYFREQGVAPGLLSLYGAPADPAMTGLAAPVVATFELQGPAAGSVAVSRGGSNPVPLNTQPLLYRLEIAMMRGAFTGAFMDDLADPLAERDVSQPLCHYLTGRFRSFAEAERERQSLIQRGLIGARIIPYIDGRRASEADAARHLRRFPDLQNYLQRGTRN